MNYKKILLPLLAVSVVSLAGCSQFVRLKVNDNYYRIGAHGKLEQFDPQAEHEKFVVKQFNEFGFEFIKEQGTLESNKSPEQLYLDLKEEFKLEPKQGDQVLAGVVYTTEFYHSWNLRKFGYPNTMDYEVMKAFNFEARLVTSIKIQKTPQGSKLVYKFEGIERGKMSQKVLEILKTIL